LAGFLNTGYKLENLSGGGVAFVVRRHLRPGHDYANSTIPVGGSEANLWLVHQRLAEENLTDTLLAAGMYGVGCCRLTYGSRVTYHLTAEAQFGNLSDGYTLTAVGEELALLCERTTNELGERIFTDEAKYGVSAPSDGEAMRAMLEDRLKVAESGVSRAFNIEDIQSLLAAYVRQFGDPGYLNELGDLAPRVEAILAIEEERLRKKREAAKAVKPPTRRRRGM
jgi:hypothetical protein